MSSARWPAIAPWVAPALAFVAGFADASTFVAADGIFSAHATGNLVVLATDVARGGRPNDWLKALTFPVFFVTVIAMVRLEDFLHVASRLAGRALLGIEAALLGAAAVAGLAHGANRVSVAHPAAVLLTVAGLAVQNTFQRVAPQLGPMTTVMTGNLVQWLTHLHHGPRSENDRAKQRALEWLLVMFTLGCFAGAMATAQLGLGALGIPAFIVIAARATL
ncbi:MAG: DUF1275 domain-containing protein [Polyangiaceae bacterium]|nr:DUF1275 domain-containing protein [Polyangiaceae bacterium]